jgi:hypothetical protein
MNPWPFILGAYAITFLGVGGLSLWAYLAMCSAEAEASGPDK